MVSTPNRVREITHEDGRGIPDKAWIHATPWQKEAMSDKESFLSGKPSGQIAGAQKGLIVYFDILGYQSFLENNSAPDSARDVLRMITSIPLEVRADIAGYWKMMTPPAQWSVVERIPDSMQHVVFSDTIVFLLRYPPDKSVSWHAGAMAFMTFMACKFAAKMFQAGLPTRGVIHEGEFILEDMCFAGRGMVEAYKLCVRLDFGGLVLSESVEATMKEVSPFQPVVDGSQSNWLLVPILTPLKNSPEKRMVHVNWFYPQETIILSRARADIIQYVLTAFWAHEKDCPVEVDGKIRNTCKIIRRLLLAGDTYLRRGTASDHIIRDDELVREVGTDSEPGNDEANHAS